MTVVSEEVLEDIVLARDIISKTDYSVVVIRYGKIWKQKKGDGIKPLLEVIEEMGNDIHGSVIGGRILGKASAMLCRYAKAGGVYSPRGTKTGIAVLIMGCVPCQVDELIPFIKDNVGNDVCSFEKILDGVDSPDEAYKILKTNISEK